jgi:hypothetical protein
MGLAQALWQEWMPRVHWFVSGVIKSIPSVKFSRRRMPSLVHSSNEFAVRVGMRFLACQLEREPFFRAADESHAVVADRESASGFCIGDFDFRAVTRGYDCATIGDELVDQLVYGHIGVGW